jgi:predicted permease
MNTIGIIAMRKGLNPTLIVQMIGISIPLSFVFVPIVYFILQNI